MRRLPVAVVRRGANTRPTATPPDDFNALLVELDGITDALKAFAMIDLSEMNNALLVMADSIADIRHRLEDVERRRGSGL